MDFVTSTTAEWLLEISGLTVGTSDGPDVVHRGHELAALVRSAAAAYRAANTCAQPHDAERCALSAFDGGLAACELATVLSPGVPVPATDSDATRAGLLYVQALRAASTAVFHCRRHAHPAGECWFAPTGPALCGDVLAVAHRMGA